MWYKKYTTFQYLVLAGALIVALCEWGSVNSFITIALVVLTGLLIPFGKWLWSLRPPFKVAYRVDNVFKATRYTDEEINKEIFPNETWICTDAEMILGQNASV